MESGRSRLKTRVPMCGLLYSWGVEEELECPRTQAGGDLRYRDRRLLRRLRFFGQRDNSKADRSRKKRERSVQMGISAARHSRSDIDTAGSGEETLPGVLADVGAVSSTIMRPRQIRRIFFAELCRLIRLIWPILSGVLFAMVGPGLLIGHIEGWRIVDALYFTF